MRITTYKGLLVFFLLFVLRTSAQIAGSFTVPIDFPDMAAAINTLQVMGVAGPVTIHVNAGYTETVAVGGLKLYNVTGASATNSIVFQKNGSGPNPLLVAYTGTSTPTSSVQDGVWALLGADYITIDGFDIYDPNTTNPATMEYGIAFYNNSPSDGCQHNKIINCRISLSRVNSAAAGSNTLNFGGSRGIDVSATSHLFNTFSIGVSALSGSHSYNKFYNNLIENCHIGITLVQPNTTYLARRNDVGGLSPATSNTIQNFGGSPGVPSYGIRTLGQDSINLGYNIINNDTGTGSQPQSSICAIYLGQSNTRMSAVHDNTISLTCHTPTVEVRGIYNLSGSATATVAISNNRFSSFTFSANPSFTTGASVIQNAQSNGTVNISGNLIENVHALRGIGRLITTESASLTIISSNTITNVNGYAAANNTVIVMDHGLNGPQLIKDNLIDGLSGPCPMSCLESSKVVPSLTVTGNTFRNAVCGKFSGIVEYMIVPLVYINNNQIYNYTTHVAAAEGSFTGIRIPYVSTNSYVSANRIYSVNCSSGTGSVTGDVTGIDIDMKASSEVAGNRIGALYSSGPGSVRGIVTNGGGRIFNNLVGDLRQTYANNPMAIAGITMLGVSVKNLFYNTVYINETANTGPNFGSAAVNAYGYSLVTALTNNNILVNTSVPTGTCATYASSLQSASYYTASNNNIFYAGVPSAGNQLIKLGATTSYSTLSSFTAAVATAESQSRSELPPFTSTVVTDPDFLNINPAIPTMVEAGGLPIANYTTDYSGAPRHVTTPDIGAWEGNFLQADILPPALVASGFTTPGCELTGRTLTLNITDATGVASGSLSPRLFYRRNFGLYTSTQGSLTSGTATNGVWTFTMVYPGAPGDVIRYFLTMQDISPLNNLVLIPSTGGSVTSVNTVPTPPTTTFTFMIDTPPTVSVNSGSICSGASFTILPGGADSYTITGGDFTVNPLTTTSYSVIGTNTAGCLSSNTAVASVSVITSPTISVNSGSVCSGTAFTITPSGADTYIVSGGNMTVTPLTSENYTVTGTNTLGGCVSAPVTASVQVFTTPTISVNSGSICAGETFTILPTGADLYTISGNATVVSPAASTVYLVSGTSHAGCVSSNTVTSSLTVAPLPTLSVSDATICSNTAYTLSPTGASSYTYSGGSSVVSPATHTFYTISGTSSAGCVSSNTVTANITVKTSPTISVNSGSICAGETFTIVPSDPTLTYTYPGGSALVSPATTTGYTITGTNSLNCISNVAISQITVYANPTISVNSGSICLGDVFTISPSGADSYTISGGSATVSPAANTAYSVTGISTAGCPATNTVTSSLTVAPLPTLSASNGTICSGENFTISPSGAQTYHYSGGTAIVSPVTHTVYTVSGTSAVGCLSANTLTVSVTVNPSPTITVNSGSVCAGDTFTIIPSGAVSYSFEGGTSTVTPSVTGSYTVSGQSAEGCISSNTAVSTVTVFALPNLSVNNGAICAGEVFTLNPSGAISYSFSSGSATLSPATTSTYLISGSNAAGCVASIIATVQVNSLPMVTANASSTSVCSGQSLTLYGGGAQSYTWSGGISNNVAFYPSATSLYTVTGVSTQSCVKSETVLVTVLLSPSVFVTSSRDTLCVGEPLMLSASGADSYHWNSGALGDTITVVAGPPSYTVTGSSAEGCSGIATVSVFVDECTGISTTVRSSDIVIYPNPGQGVFYIKSDGEVYVQVINSLGQEVFGGAIAMENSELDLQQQAKGIYFIRIYKGSQLIQTDKLVITK